MKNICSYLFLSCLFFIQLPAAAQRTIKVYNDSVFIKNADTSVHGFNNAKTFYISQWERPVPHSIKVIRKIDEHNAIISVSNKKVFDSLSYHVNIAAASDNWKLSPAAKKELQRNKENQKFTLTGYNLDELITVLKNRSKEFSIVWINRPSRSVVVECKTKYVRDILLPLKEIIFIDAYAEPQAETGIIGYDRSFHGINAVDYGIPGANGKNIVVGVKEQNIDEDDIDLYKRVLPSSIAAPATTNHATVIASIIGGAGNSFYNGRGIANACKFFPSSFANLFADDSAILNMNKVIVQNHSYGTIVQQFYGAEAVSYDALTWNNKNFVAVFSAGNEGLSSATEGNYANIQGYANLTGNFKMAKNIITVGAIDNKKNIPAESSAGPLYDGRLAPQLMALGPNGTSDAAAIVSGTIAVMQQVYADSNNQALPPASLIKAILYNTAEDVYNIGIDYKTGYGLLNSYASIKNIQQKKYDGGSLAESQMWTKNITVPANAAQLKITLVWTDSAATVNNNKAIVNDLDIEVKDLGSGIVYKPWVLNSSPNVDSLARLPTRERDSLNTAEQISIPLPTAGVYEVKVIGTAISSSSVPFNIAYGIDTLNTFTFLSPQNASDVNRSENENLTIKWKTFVADTNQTGNLYISYNYGASWQVVKRLIKIYTNQYEWAIKDTNSVATLKMETSFGTFLSKNFIISKVIRPIVDFNCVDSFRLSWNKHIYANAYKIYTLIDSPYLKHILTVTDTFKVFRKADYPSLVYAVEPMLSNGLGATRSPAININLQGVKCFFKTLNYNLLDNNVVNLILELSIADYADSIYFEKISPAGQLQQIYGSAKVISSIVIYNQLVNNPEKGITYFRGRIKLKSGEIVYTDVISVLTTGKQLILFYPNPARGNNLNFVLQQGISSDSHIQLFDVVGRLLKDFSSLSGQIDISGLPTGIVIYRLISNNNTILDTGKIMLIR
jgi:hypothetical protein